MLTTIKNLSIQRTLGHESGAAATAGRSKLWRTPVAAAALALSLGLGALDAHALALGRINVLSALGEPLRAEIEVPDINAEEAASLNAKIASGDAFRAAGLEYNAALSTVQISLQRRANGSAYLRLSSDRPINEPFVDIILETSWSTGRVVRDYTMLFDPSNMRTAPAVTASPVLPAPSASPAPSRAAAPAPYSAPSAPARSAERRTARATAPVASPAPAAKTGSVTVKAGNTATQLAVRYKPEGISLDQMLVAMLSANPDAFVNGNINRLRKGAVLDMPTAATAGATSPDQARQTISAQSKDFNEFRRRLAQGLPTTTAPSASRKAAGTVQAEVQDRKPATAAPDKLTLSKGAVAAASAAKSAASTSKEDAIAKEKQAKEAAARTAELSKNIQDLNKLVTATVASPSAKPANTASAATAAATTAPAAASASSSAKPGVTIAAGAPVPSAAPTPTVAAPPPAAPAPATPTAVVTPTIASVTPTASVAATVTPTSVTTASTAPASATVAQAAPTKPKVVAPPVPEPSLVDSLLDNPLTMPAAGGLLALLAGFGFYRFRQRKSSGQVDSSFLESRLQPDSFFGASGGQRIDTNDAAGAVTGSSMVYSPSQLDAAGDVDPVAEADVYLAYGRDLQAEEILKEAMRTNPSRVAIHAKLMEIYAKRRDTKAFETVANEAFSVTKGHGTEWEAAAAMGRDLDPNNPLYQGISMGSMGSSNMGGGVALAAAGALAASAAFATQTSPQAAQLGATDNNVDFDLDLDFSAGNNTTSASAMNQALHGTTSPIHVQTTVAMKPQVPDSIDSAAMDLVFDSPSVAGFDATNSGLIDLSPPDLATFDQKLSFPDPKPAMGAIAPTAPMSIATAPAPAMDALEFDLGDLSLDLPGPSSVAAASAAASADMSGDPLETKLALAQEFREIGDNDGARSLAQEVAAEASGALKARAQRMVADLS